MSDVQFFQTRMGQHFYDGTMPKIAEALQRIASALEARPDAVATWRNQAAGDTLDAIAARLSGRAWTPDDLDAIAALVRATGRQVRDYNPSDAEND